MIVQDIYIYTIGGAVMQKTIAVPQTVRSFDEQLCKAIEQGGALVDTIDGTRFFINTAATAAVETGEQYEYNEGAADLTASKNSEISPRLKILKAIFKNRV